MTLTDVNQIADLICGTVLNWTLAVLLDELRVHVGLFPLWLNQGPLIPVSCISTNPLGLIIWFSVTQIFSLLKVFFFPSPITKCFTLKHPYSHLITIISRSPQFSSNDMQFKNIRYSHKNDYRGFLTIVSPYNSINLNMIYALKTTLWENFHLSDCMHVERFQP